MNVVGKLWKRVVREFFFDDFFYNDGAGIVDKYHIPRALRALVPQVHRALHALVPHVPCVLRASCLVSHVSYVLLYLTRLGPCVFSGCSSLELYVLLFFLSLTCFRCFKPNMISCISCLVAFMPCASCAFRASAL